MFVDPSLQHMLLGVTGGFGPHAEGSTREWHPPWGDVWCATQQKHLLDGTFDGIAHCAVLAQSQQPALDDFTRAVWPLGRCRFGGDRGARCGPQLRCVRLVRRLHR